MKVFFGLPAYTGQAVTPMLGFLLNMQRTLRDHQIDSVLGALTGSGLIANARQKLVEQFLTTDCTHYVSLDNDMGFDVDDFLRMLAYAERSEYEVIAAGYPRREIDWERIKRAVLENPEIDPALLPLAGQRWVLNVLGDDKDIDIDEPFEVAELGMGGFVIQREVFGKMAAPYFDCYWQGKLYIGEDYAFCRKWREAGGKVWLAPWVRSVHVGSYEFRGDMRQHAQLGGLDAS